MGALGQECSDTRVTCVCPCVPGGAPGVSSSPSTPRACSRCLQRRGFVLFLPTTCRQGWDSIPPPQPQPRQSAAVPRPGVTSLPHSQVRHCHYPVSPSSVLVVTWARDPRHSHVTGRNPQHVNLPEFLPLSEVDQTFLLLLERGLVRLQWGQRLWS